GQGRMCAYNGTNVSFSGYTLTGSTAGDSDVSITVTFTPASANADVGFFWGGHLARGLPTTWGLGNGSGSINGGPYHMHAVNFDNGGGANQDRNIQNDAICLPPQATITADAGPYCSGSTHTASAPAGAGSYTWTVSGATIDSGQGTNSITFTVDEGGSVTIGLTACNTTSTCPGDSCCNTGSTTVTVNPSPSCSISGTNTFCAGSTGNNYTSTISRTGGRET